ncbi:homeobox-leucine zipper protein ATHB-52 [Mercurialis annua]|uniref:homeobox-leucine zipper protein ATHB-52 n=1 Tax=Mercurialis annua TaxID=3986 RepID=UPI00215F2429|nr:homeobox-leucine zipper protein ATHB-52 [Mercurialis annua]
MDFFHAQNQQKHTPKHTNKKRLTQDQVRLLERTFTNNKKLDPELKHQLSNQLAVPPRQIAIWYQNKRARWKTQSLELDYNTLQVKLDNALNDKRRLERELMQIKEELKKSQEMVFALNQGLLFPNPRYVNHHPHHPLRQHRSIINNVSCNSSCDEGGSSSLHNEEVNGEVLQLDELYACFIGSGGGGGGGGNGDGSTWG